MNDEDSGAGPLVDEDRLAAWMDGRGLAPGAPLRVERVTTGHSNEVFAVRRGALHLALRRPPRTPLSPTAHDMAREHRVISALARAGTAVPVAQAVALCDDAGVIGAPFYLMELLDGVVVRDSLPAPFDGVPGAPRAIAELLIDILVAIHAVDWRSVGLGDFGRPDGYLERQVDRWLGQLRRYRVRPLPDVDEAGRWLAAHVPPAQPPALIHGDYKLDNLMLARSLPPSALAVLDWEQSTIGDPLVDVGWVLGLWHDPGEEVAASFNWSVSGMPGAPGVPRRSDLAARYAERTGRDLGRLAFYCTLGLFKLACVLEGSFARHVAGTSDDPYFATLEAGVPALARRALSFSG
ncbi:MAG TPA: phosphotransferase family protein [Candidatus Dormibacteraeota bacterium]|jgi:aminoglycoside phosphotransferase (APT) family kinase protein|nr:phosphotransferase family protein [Candidatus Dormibacteraeota bacterium]